MGQMITFSQYMSEMKKPKWEVPAKPGSTPTPEGKVKLYHQTGSKGALSNMRRKGILPHQPVEGPRGIYAQQPDSQGRGFYGHPRDVHTAEFHVDKDDWKAPFVHRDKVEKEKIVATHRPWHAKVRYIDSNPEVRKAVEAGEHDDLMKTKGEPTGKAVRFIKKRMKAKK
jgi:hypothetical protein